MKVSFIKYIVLIAVVLILVFMSQQPYFSGIGKNTYIKETIKQVNIYWNKTTDWLMTKVYPKAGREVAERGELAKREIEKQKKNILQNIWETIENYFKKKFSEFFGTKIK